MDKRQRFNSRVNGKIIVPMQAFGLGDIIFCVNIARAWQNLGYRVLWPVQPQFLDGCTRAYPDLRFIEQSQSTINWNMKRTHEHDGMTVVPLRWTYEILRVPYVACMRSKYDYVCMDWRNWKTGSMWRRDADKEAKLFTYLNLGGEPYVVVNRRYRSDSTGLINIPITTGVRVVEMQQIPGFSLFDWALVLERAAEIHTVSTALLYIVELLRLPTHFYVRYPDEKSHKNYDYLLSEIHYLH